jgi:hypothetical protein
MHAVDNDEAQIVIRLVPHRGIKAPYSSFQQPSPGHDKLSEGRRQLVPSWRILSILSMRQCREHGVVVEYIPWSAGELPVKTAMMGLLLAGRGGSAVPHDFCSASTTSMPLPTLDNESATVIGDPAPIWKRPASHCSDSASRPSPACRGLQLPSSQSVSASS